MAKSQLCRGRNTEIATPPNFQNEEMVVGKNSTCVLGQPNKRNFVNLFATVECK
jgi:hypothetical protein